MLHHSLIAQCSFLQMYFCLIDRSKCMSSPRRFYSSSSPIIAFNKSTVISNPTLPAVSKSQVLLRKLAGQALHSDLSTMTIITLEK